MLRRAYCRLFARVLPLSDGKAVGIEFRAAMTSSRDPNRRSASLSKLELPAQLVPSSSLLTFLAPESHNDTHSTPIDYPITYYQSLLSTPSAQAALPSAKNTAAAHEDSHRP